MVFPIAKSYNSFNFNIITDIITGIKYEMKLSIHTYTHPKVKPVTIKSK